MGKVEEMERCPKCQTLAHGRFRAKCDSCGVDKTAYGYVVPERKPFKNFLYQMNQGK